MVPIPFSKRLAREVAHRVVWETMQSKYTPFDPEAQDSQHTVNTAFVAQSSTDICHQLQQQRDNFTQC